MGSIPPSEHSTGTSNRYDPLKTEATKTTAQTAPRDLRASFCWRDMPPRDVITPAATSWVYKMWASLARSFLAKEGAQPVPRGPPRRAATADAASTPPTCEAPLPGGIEDGQHASGPFVVPQISKRYWDGALTINASLPPLKPPPLTPLAPNAVGDGSMSASGNEVGGTRDALASAVTPGARSRAALCTRQRSSRSALRLCVGRPRLLRRERRSSTVTRDAFLKI